MRCVNCNGELIPGKPFCPSCGTPVARKCPSCGASVGASFRFCPDCGTAIAAGGSDAPSSVSTTTAATTAAATPPTPSAPLATAGERKLVTVLFSDLVGSTAIAERLDPEEYRDLLEQYMALAFREIYKVEGIVTQLAGDGLMALFGAPIAHEDAPHRAVKAALAIRDALAVFNRELRAQSAPELEIRIGIHTGPVVVGTVGNDMKMDYTAIGDTTNLASRLQALAPPGAILVSAATHRLVRGAFQVKSTGPFAVKGKREPVTAYEVLGTSDAETPMAIAAARGLTPFVGRSAELTQLGTCYQRMAENLAQVVAIVGDAGNGKSRLIYEFKRQLAGEPVAYFEARCSALTQSIPYAPIIAMLRQHFGITPGESVEGACEKIAQKVRTLEPKGDMGVDDVYPALCRLLSIPAPGVAKVSADESKQETFDAVGALVGGTSRQSPVIMIIEDLHWMDDASREMIELAVARMDQARVMMIVSHRSDYVPFWRSRAVFTQLNLRPLADPDATAIIRAVAGGRLPAALERKLLARAEGNPFFLEEITRALKEEGYLLRGDGHVRLTRPVAEVGIPDTIQELIAARLDRLGTHAKRVAQVAAVLGRQFCRLQLAQLLDGEGIDVEGELDRLEESGLVHRKSALSKDEYRFGESLAQDVAYETLLLKERRQLHERVGVLLEAYPGETDAERAALLAHHYGRSDNRIKAVEAFLRAAHGAEQLPSYSAALNLYRQSWELAEAALAETDGNDEHLKRAVVDATFGLCRIAVLYGPSHAVDVDRAGWRGRELAEALGDVSSQIGLLSFHGFILMSSARDQFAPGLALVEEALALAQRAGTETNVLSVSRGLAWSYLTDGQFELATRTINWVMAELERQGYREQLTDLYFGARWALHGVLYYSDDLEGALQHALDVYPLALKAGNRTSQSGAMSTEASVYFERAQYARALEAAERSLEVAQAISASGTVRAAAALAMAARAELGETGPFTRYTDLIEEGLVGASIPLNGAIVVESLLTVGDLDRARRVCEVMAGAQRWAPARSTDLRGIRQRLAAPRTRALD